MEPVALQGQSQGTEKGGATSPAERAGGSGAAGGAGGERGLRCLPARAQEDPPPQNDVKASFKPGSRAFRLLEKWLRRGPGLEGRGKGSSSFLHVWIFLVWRCRSTRSHGTGAGFCPADPRPDGGKRCGQVRG